MEQPRMVGGPASLLHHHGLMLDSRGLEEEAHLRAGAAHRHQLEMEQRRLAQHLGRVAFGTYDILLLNIHKRMLIYVCLILLEVWRSEINAFYRLWSKDLTCLYLKCSNLTQPFFLKP